MSTITYFKRALKDMHGNYVDAVKDLTDEQLHFRPLDKGHHIAFALWHVVRTEDMVINFLLQKKTPVWNAREWDKKLGMDPQAQGTGMNAEQAAAVRISSLPDFLAYMDAVGKETDAYLDTLKDEDLDIVNELPVLGKRSLCEVIGGIALVHAAEHLGEIWYIKGLLGLKGSAM
ncbi:MAG: DinB family protein [Desulfobacterales bacterium]